MTQFTSLAEAMLALSGSMPTSNLTPAKPAKQQAKRKSTKTLHWEDPTFGSLEISSTGSEIGDQANEGPFSWGYIFPLDINVQRVYLAFSGKAPEGGWLFRVTTKEITDCTNDKIRSLTVPVTWRDDTKSIGVHVPLVKQDSNDVSFVFLKPDGSFIQLEAAVVNRDAVGNLGFFATLQVVWQGQVVKVSDSGYRVMPTHLDHAYPGADYLKSAVGADIIVAAAVERNAFVQLADYTPVEWGFEQPTVSEKMVKKGYEAGITLWFNVSLGGGQVQLADGRICFVHMKTIMGEDGTPAIKQGLFPLLLPRHGVALQTKTDDRGRLQAKFAYAL